MSLDEIQGLNLAALDSPEDNFGNLIFKVARADYDRILPIEEFFVESAMDI